MSRNSLVRVLSRSLMALAASAALTFASASSAPLLSSTFINPNAPYPECHSSTIVETSPGNFVAAWFGGTKEGNPDITIWVARYENGQWTPATSVADGIQEDGSQLPTWNPVLFQAPDGPLHLYYKVAAKRAPWTGFEKVSHDGGLTWSAPRQLPDGIIGPVKNKPVILSDGSWLSGSSTEHTDGWIVHFEHSTDAGKTWSKTAPVSKGIPPIEAIQPSILMHEDGTLQALGRTKSGRLFTTSSHDAGKTWTPLSLSELPNPNAGTDAVTLSDGRHLLVYNNSTTGTVRADKGYRYPLDVALSEDGVTWEHVLVLDSEPASAGYAYPSVIQAADGLVHITYTWDRKKIKHVVIDPAEFD